MREQVNSKIMITVKDIIAVDIIAVDIIAMSNRHISQIISPPTPDLPL
jgi:uncharacterized protein (DUF362 family)